MLLRIPHSVSLLLVIFSESSIAQTLVSKTIGQLTACAGQNNVLHIDLSFNAKLFRKDEPSITISGLVNTGSQDSDQQSIVDHALKFSNIAILVFDVMQDDSVVYLDNTYSADLTVGDMIRIDSECLEILSLNGIGCNRSTLVLDSCWNSVDVLRGQLGTSAAGHSSGSLAYKIIAGTLMDSNILSDGSVGIDNQQTIINLDRNDGFANQSVTGGACFCKIDEESLMINEVVKINGSIRAIVKDLNGIQAILPANWSSQNNFYQYMQLLFTDGPRKGFRRTIQQYDGKTKKATLDFTNWNIAAGWNFTIIALKVQRAQFGTGGGTLEVSSGVYIVLGKPHPQNSTVFFTNSEFSIFPQVGSWTMSTGTLSFFLIADTDFAISTFSVPISNPIQSQLSPMAIKIEVGRRPLRADGTNGAYVTTTVDRLSKNTTLTYALPISAPLMICEAGTFTAPGRSNCTACPIGKYSEACGGFECLLCPSSTYSSSPGQTGCQNCDLGYFCPGNSDQQPCPPGSYSDTSASICITCPVANFCPGSSTYFTCEAGTSNAALGASECSNCPPGNFSSVPGSLECSVCSTGTFSNIQRATTCTSCGAGKYSNVSGLTACFPCPENQYQTQSGATGCLWCPQNTGARWSMGECTGACGGSSSPEDCLCKVGFTKFGLTGDSCIAIRFDSAVVGQTSSCASKSNLITVTFSSNAAITTAVQEIIILDGGIGYVPGSVIVNETGGRFFFANFTVDRSGIVTGISISVPGTGYSGNPFSVHLLYGDDCAANSSGCESKEQDGTIAEIYVVHAGYGYVPGTILAMGGGGHGCEATFSSYVCDATLIDDCEMTFGNILSISFPTAESHGSGYFSAPYLSIRYNDLTRCDDGLTVQEPKLTCEQRNTITSVLFVGAKMTGCDLTTKIYSVGGGGVGFEAAVVAVSPFGSILQTGVSIINHGVNYTSDPQIVLDGPDTCSCDGVEGSIPGAFSGCIQLVRAQGAELFAIPAQGAKLDAVTGSKVLVSRFPTSVRPSTSSSEVPIWSIPAVSVAVGFTQSAGVLSDGLLLSWGKSETFQTEKDVMTWRCGFSSRYYRFVALAVRNGGNSVHLSEIELYAVGQVQKLTIIAATNVGGSSPQGFASFKAVDGDPETSWLDTKRAPLVLDVGEEYVIEKYRWMTAPDQSGLDPVSWQLQAFSGAYAQPPSDNPNADHWITIHEMSTTWNHEYFFIAIPGPRNSTIYPRTEYTPNMTGSCVFPTSKTWRHISFGYAHGCGITTAGIAVCWGQDDWGQLNFPGEPCSCSGAYGSYCICESATYDSDVYQKIVLATAPSQCNSLGCYNTYGQGTCDSQACEYIYDAATCRDAAIAMELVEDSIGKLLPQSVPIFPKGCYWVSDPNADSRLFFNAANRSSACTSARNCLCQNCPEFRFVLYAQGRYCGGSFDNNNSQLANAYDVQTCSQVCTQDADCDFFTFYTAKTSVWCAPCCFKAKSQCTLVDPNKVSPNVKGVRATANYDFISAGYLHTCGVLSNGSALCWGYNRNGQCDIPQTYVAKSWKSIAAGRFHSCGIVDDLTVECWGATGDKTIDVGQVLPVPGNGGYRWIYISVGPWHSCGITEDSNLHCWGCGGRDRIGRPIGISAWGESIDKGQCDVPPAVGNWLSVSAGEYHTCGVTKSGLAYCWGCRCNPILCPAWNSSDVNFGQCDIPEGYTWSFIAAGTYHSCGIAQSERERIICWGAKVNTSKVFWDSKSDMIVQNPSLAGFFDQGQTDAPFIEEWTDPSLFRSTGMYSSSTGSLVLSVRKNSLPGSKYMFSFSIMNPALQQQALVLTLNSEGVSLFPIVMANAPDPLGPARTVACSPGTYDPQRCIPCSPGTATLDCGVSSCAACNPGQYSYVGFSICVQCAFGTFSEFPGSTICTACPQGTFGNVTGALSAYDGCLACDSGTYADTYHKFDSVARVWSIVGSSSCTICPHGHFCSGAEGYSLCPVGTWNNELGSTNSTACLVCPRPERCNGLWPRMICISGDGFSNGTTFYDTESCNKSCLSQQFEPGRCVSQLGKNNGCENGYSGRVCMECDIGYYPDFIDEECKACPPYWSAALLLVIYTGVTILIFLCCDVFQLDWKFVIYYRVLVFFLQSQDLSLSVNIRWPDFLAYYVRWLRIFDFHVMSASPQCFLGNTNTMWLELYRYEILFPLFVAGFLSFVAMIPFLHSGMRRCLWRLEGNFLAWYTVPFLLALFSSLNCSCVPVGYELLRKSWYNCSFANSRLAVDDDPYVECFSSEHYEAFAASIFILIVLFVVAPIPIFCLIPQRRHPSHSGRIKITNIGRSKAILDAQNIFMGCGFAEFVQREIEAAREVISSAENEILRLQDVQLDEKKQGKKREFLISQAALNDTLQAKDAFEQRLEMLKGLRSSLEDCLKAGESIKEMQMRQRKGMRECRLRTNANILNFVHTVEFQKRQFRGATNTIKGVGRRQGMGWLDTSPAFVTWKIIRKRVYKTSLELDVFRKYFLQSSFYAVAVFVFPFAALFTLSYWVLTTIRQLIPVPYHIYASFQWADYGVRQNVEGQVIRAIPEFGQYPITNTEQIRGKIVMVRRGRGTMHEANSKKVDRIVHAGAMAVIVVNEGRSSFVPRVVTENFMLSDAIRIPVFSISSKDAEKIADGSIITLTLSYPIKLVGMSRFYRIVNCALLSPVMEPYSKGKHWFEVAIFLRKLFLVVARTYSTRFPPIQAVIILGIQMVFAVLSLQRPYVNQDLNSAETAVAFASLLTSLAVAMVSTILGNTSESSPGLEPRGSAGTTEDMLRSYAFHTMSLVLICIIIFTCVYILLEVVTLMVELCLFRKDRKKIVHIEKATVEKHELPTEAITPNFESAIHAIAELQRVRPVSCICSSAVMAVYCAMREQVDVTEARDFIEHRNLRRRPWVFSIGTGSAGFFKGKPIMCFLHRISGIIVEIPASSTGEIRFRPHPQSRVYGCLTDGIVWDRESFFAPALASTLADCPGNGRNAVFAGDVGRWQVRIYTPKIVIKHVSKDMQVWMTRRSCYVLLRDDRSIALDGSPTAANITRHAVIDAVAQETTVFPDALSAIHAARRLRVADRRLPPSQRAHHGKPKCALEAILQALDAFPEELSASQLFEACHLDTELTESTADSSDRRVSSPMRDQHRVSNAAVITWRRPGKPRRPPDLYQTPERIAREDDEDVS